MTINALNFQRIHLLIDCIGTDEVCLIFGADIPSPYPLMGYEGSARIHVQAEYGLEWIRKTFGREPDEIISMKTGRVK